MVLSPLGSYSSAPTAAAPAATQSLPPNTNRSPVVSQQHRSAGRRERCRVEDRDDRREATLNDLRYVWPAGFARFVLQARNPGLQGAMDLPAVDRAALEAIVGCRLRTIWARY